MEERTPERGSTVKEELDMTTFPNSTELIEMAHREWTNRQKRKGHNDEVAWTSGWISGYVTGRGTQ